MLRYIDNDYEMPNKAEVHLWTHGDDHEEDDEETVCAMLDAPEDAEELEEAKENPEDLEDARHLYSMVTSGPYD